MLTSAWHEKQLVADVARLTNKVGAWTSFLLRTTMSTLPLSKSTSLWTVWSKDFMGGSRTLAQVNSRMATGSTLDRTNSVLRNLKGPSKTRN